MLLISHITIALASLLFAGIAYFRPAPSRLNISYVLVGLTVATGTVLTVRSPAHLMQTCATGLVYLVIVFAAIFSARAKLARN